MRKTLQDLTRYLKEIIVPETHDEYDINPLFSEISTHQNIYKGILAYRTFLILLYDTLYTKANIYDNSKKVAHEYENRTTLSVYYPFLHYVRVILLNIGYNGKLIDNKHCKIDGNKLFNKKISIKKNLECLQFIMDCGFCIDGIDINKKRQKIFELKHLNITYPKNPYIFLGLKILAIAEIDHHSLVNQDVFLRCDYRVLKSKKPDVLTILNDMIKPLSTNVQKFVIQLHNLYTEKGIKSNVEIKGFHIYIKYSYKRKVLWGFNASLNNGYHINVKPTKTDKYIDAIKSFSPFLQELITKGYGCGRKGDVGQCDGGCRGIPIPLDNSVLDIQNDIKTWFDYELLYL